MLALRASRGLRQIEMYFFIEQPSPITSCCRFQPYMKTNPFILYTLCIGNIHVDRCLHTRVIDTLHNFNSDVLSN